MYAQLVKILKPFLSEKAIFKHGFNISPMYRRSRGKVTDVSDGLMTIDIKIPLNYKNRNYAGSMFGGSMFSATDPIYMVQLLQILGQDYVVWDKSAIIKYKRPAKETVYASFNFSKEEVEKIKSDVAISNEINLVKKVNLTNKDASVVFAALEKTIYIADKKYYKFKKKKK